MSLENKQVLVNYDIWFLSNDLLKWFITITYCQIKTKIPNYDHLLLLMLKNRTIKDTVIDNKKF